MKKVGQVDVLGRRMDYGLLEDGRGSMIRVVMGGGSGGRGGDEGGGGSVWAMGAEIALKERGERSLRSDH